MSDWLTFFGFPVKNHCQWKWFSWVKNRGIISGNLNKCFIFVAKDRCERIADATCSAQQYRMTRMPNFFRHKSQSEASGELNKFRSVIQTNCSSELNFFLCSLYLPRCKAYKALPCKELCVRVKKNCRVQFREMGFKFPVSCSKLPRKEESGSQCIDGTRLTQMAKTTPSSAGK